MSNKATKISMSFGNGKTFDSGDYYFEGVKNLLAVTERMIEEVTLNGADYAKKSCPRDTGELENSIYFETKALKNGAKGEVICDSDHAMYVEFGTGVVGQAFAYPGNLGEWEYNIPTEFKDETGGWHWGRNYTHGYPNNPFMYNTAKYMEGVAPTIARRIINGK